jgi:hypothetical protein
MKLQFPFNLRGVKMIFIIAVLAAILLLYIFLTWNFNYWQNQGIAAPKPKILLGDLPNVLLRKKHVAYDLDKIYKYSIK